jgi:hypothetical protein
MLTMELMSLALELYRLAMNPWYINSNHKVII